MHGDTLRRQRLQPTGPLEWLLCGQPVNDGDELEIALPGEVWMPGTFTRIGKEPALMVYLWAPPRFEAARSSTAPDSGWTVASTVTGCLLEETPRDMTHAEAITRASLLNRSKRGLPRTPLLFHRSDPPARLRWPPTG